MVSRNGNDKKLAGVCAGLVDDLAIDPMMVRLIRAALFGVDGFSGLIYLVVWAIAGERTITNNMHIKKSPWAK